jgi:hypothetical protein
MVSIKWRSHLEAGSIWKVMDFPFRPKSRVDLQFPGERPKDQNGELLVNWIKFTTRMVS